MIITETTKTGEAIEIFCNCWSEVAIQNWLLLATLITTTVVSFWLYSKTKKENIRKSLDDKLFFLQQLSFNKPFLEEDKFVKNWLVLRKKYLDEKATAKQKEECLQYETYCEMLFNYLADTYFFLKKEKKILNYVAFKEWIRIHKLWWQNPLEKHSNNDSYDKKLCKIIDDWLK